MIPTLLLAVTINFSPARPTVGDPITVNFPSPVVVQQSKDYEILAQRGNRVVVRTFEPKPFVLHTSASDVVIPVHSVLKANDKLDPAPLKIRSVVSGLDKTDTDADPRITVIKTLDDGHTVIDTPRYRAFTEIMRGLAARNRNFTEIAGNDDILVTVKVPPGEAVEFPGAKPLFEVPIQAKPGWRRVGLDVKVPALTDLIRKLTTTKVELEHVYDY